MKLVRTIIDLPLAYTTFSLLELSFVDDPRAEFGFAGNKILCLKDMDNTRAEW